MHFFRKVFGKAKTAKSLEDASLGCILGACAGDAADAPLEMLGRKPDEDIIERALTMPGVGKLEFAPGQIADDGEPTLCLAQGLAECGSLQLDPIARRYADWVRSRPFDMGFAIRRSNDTCLHAASCYVTAIAFLMNHPGDRRKALGKARAWTEKYANAEVNQWRADARGGRQIPCHPHAGFVKIAFTLAFRHSEAGSNCVEALRQTLA